MEGGVADICGWAVAAHFCFTKHSNNVHTKDHYLGPFDSENFAMNSKAKTVCIIYITINRFYSLTQTTVCYLPLVLFGKNGKSMNSYKKV